MTDPATGQRSLLQALKVPFDLKGVALGALVFLVMTWGARLMGVETSPWEYLGRIGRSGVDFRAWGLDETTFWMVAALKLVVIAVFGVAMCRIAAMRLARDEGVGLRESLLFSTGNLVSTLGAFAFMGGAMAFFYACNALAGLASGIPGVGPVLMVVLFPLVLLSTLILFLLGFGSILGMPLAVASLAVERNGPLDAVSRGFSYVFSRPALFFFYGLTVWFLAAVLVACTFAMEGLAAWSFTHWFPASDSWRHLGDAVGRATSAVVRTRMPDFTGVGGSAALGGWVAWFFGVLFHLALMGWVVYYYFGGATAAYFALRRDVDGTEDEEIWVEGEDQGAFGEPERPEPASGGAAPGKAVPGTDGPAVPGPEGEDAGAKEG